MTKLTKSSPPDKRVGKKKISCPSFTRHENDLWRDLTERTKDKFCTVTPVHTPLIVSELFRVRYDEIFRRKG
jgi:hypothetical protein